MEGFQVALPKAGQLVGMVGYEGISLSFWGYGLCYAWQFRLLGGGRSGWRGLAILSNNSSALTSPSGVGCR